MKRILLAALLLGTVLLSGCSSESDGESGETESTIEEMETTRYDV